MICNLPRLKSSRFDVFGSQGMFHVSHLTPKCRALVHWLICMHPPLCAYLQVKAPLRTLLVVYPKMSSLRYVHTRFFLRLRATGLSTTHLHTSICTGIRCNSDSISSSPCLCWRLAPVPSSMGHEFTDCIWSVRFWSKGKIQLPFDVLFLTSTS